MINVKDQIYSALVQEFGPEVPITDAYPNQWGELPVIYYCEEDNRVYEYTSKEEKSYCRYRVDIWSNKPLSDLAVRVDKAIASLGLKRTQCTDVEDPSRLKHKQMRYDMVIDVETEEVYAAQQYS